MFPFDPPENRKPKLYWCFLKDQKETLERKVLIKKKTAFLMLIFLFPELKVTIQKQED